MDKRAEIQLQPLASMTRMNASHFRLVVAIRRGSFSVARRTWRFARPPRTWLPAYQFSPMVIVAPSQHRASPHRISVQCRTGFGFSHSSPRTILPAKPHLCLRPLLARLLAGAPRVPRSHSGARGRLSALQPGGPARGISHLPPPIVGVGCRTDAPRGAPAVRLRRTLAVNSLPARD